MTESMKEDHHEFLDIIFYSVRIRESWWSLAHTNWTQYRQEQLSYRTSYNTLSLPAVCPRGRGYIYTERPTVSPQSPGCILSVSACDP